MTTLLYLRGHVSCSALKNAPLLWLCRRPKQLAISGLQRRGRPPSPAELVTNSASTRLPEFVYDSENAKAQLIVSKLGAVTYARFTNHIFPKRACDAPLTDTVAVPKELFGHNTSVSARRYAYLKTQQNEEGLRDYTGLVNQRHVMAEFNDGTPKQMKCFVWIYRLVASQDADVRVRALRKIEDNPQTTLEELAAEAQHFLDIRQDAALLARSSVLHVNVVDSQKSRSREPPSPCFQCGANHWSRDYILVNKRCPDCRRSGHKRGFCKNFPEKKKRNPKQKRKSANTVTIASTRADVAVNRIYRRVQINGKKTGPAMGRPKLQSPRLTLKSANNEVINVRGCYECNFTTDGHGGYGTCHVADTSPLLGLDWIARHERLFRNLTEGSICNSSRTLSTLNSSLATHLRKKFLAVFVPGLGCCTKSKVKFALKPDSKPVFLKTRSVPYAAMPRISTEIDRVVSIHVLEPGDHSEWTALIVVVQKKNGSIRLCADYSTGLNDALEQNQHPLPTPEDTFTKLNGGRYFSQLDLAETYLQLEVDDVSKQLLTINTHRVLYRFNRLLFGVKLPPGIFQQCMDALIAGLDGTAAYLDDILVTGRAFGEHNARLEAVLKRIQDYGFRVRLDKCAFLQTEITYLEFVINAQGRLPDPEKIKSRRCPLSAPSNTLTKKDVVYTWTLECQSSFGKIKAILSSDLLLTHFDPSLPIIVAADAPNYGKFHRFIHGRHFTLRTDQKPFLAIFGSKKGVPVYSANRLQRWATMLLNYSFTIEFINTKDFGQVDALSRLVLSQSSIPTRSPQQMLMSFLSSQRTVVTFQSAPNPFGLLRKTIVLSSL
ncbi:hypothetical protein RB195_008142 [Necator americanus]|uniref:Reverse transcriptase domain-containing protein n=1 Tax=Necator americanus TaxID=51031 RepID=A0ABR1CM79_NECAM